MFSNHIVKSLCHFNVFSSFPYVVKTTQKPNWGCKPITFKNMCLKLHVHTVEVLHLDLFSILQHFPGAGWQNWELVGRLCNTWEACQQVELSARRLVMREWAKAVSMNWWWIHRAEATWSTMVQPLGCVMPCASRVAGLKQQKMVLSVIA